MLLQLNDNAVCIIDGKDGDYTMDALASVHAGESNIQRSRSELITEHDWRVQQQKAILEQELAQCEGFGYSGHILPLSNGDFTVRLLKQVRVGERERKRGCVKVVFAMCLEPTNIIIRHLNPLTTRHKRRK